MTRHTVNVHKISEGPKFCFLKKNGQRGKTQHVFQEGEDARVRQEVRMWSPGHLRCRHG